MLLAVVLACNFFAVSAAFLCPPGLGGGQCNDTCPQGWFGNGCWRKCACQNDAFCSPVDGECDCTRKTDGSVLVGREGLLCERPCRKGFWGAGCSVGCPCVAGQGECDPTTGRCQCLTGFTEQKCELPCNLFKYGFDCKKPCSCTENADACDHVTGRCICHKGWHGWICDSRCEDGFWGDNCKEACDCGGPNIPCRHSNGKCHCPAGQRLGPDWRCGVQCPAGTYGYGCDESCVMRLDRNLTGTCDPVTGDLICLPGFEGVDCKNSCPKRTFGPLCNGTCDCLNGECHHVTGECNCYKGWRGFKCQERCPQGTYGYNCSLKCSIKCLNGGFCLGHNKCGCNDGWTGENCELEEQRFLQDVQRGTIFLALLATAVILSILLLAILSFARSQTVFLYEITPTRDSESF